MANLFLGFPVPRAKIADMIDGSAPPKEHAQWHLPDGQDPIILPGDIAIGQIVKWDGSKLVGMDAPAGGNVLTPISIPPSAFAPSTDQVDYYKSDYLLRRRIIAGAADFYAPLYIPNGVTVTRVNLYGYRVDADSALCIYLLRKDTSGTVNTMCQLCADWTSGNSSMYTETINYPLIDNDTYTYTMKLTLLSATDPTYASFSMSQIQFT